MGQHFQIVGSTCCYELLHFMTVQHYWREESHVYLPLCRTEPQDPSAWTDLNTRTTGLFSWSVLLATISCHAVIMTFMFLPPTGKLTGTVDFFFFLSVSSNHNQWSQSIAFPPSLLIPPLMITVNAVRLWAVKEPADFTPSLFQQICPGGGD